MRTGEEKRNGHCGRVLFSCLCLLGFLVSACGSGQDCVPQSFQYCTRDSLYHADSCGNIGAKLSDCACGCSADHESCAACPCGMCDQPPLPFCADDHTSVAFSSLGECLDGRCEYRQSESHCPAGCDRQSGTCRSCYDCAPAGATECSLGLLQTCQSVGEDCLAWSEPSPCADGFCADDKVCGQCIHACSPLGLTECTNGELRSCGEDFYGCRVWSDFRPCADKFCGDDTSCGICDHACAQTGTSECVEARQRPCRADSDGCRFWGEWSDCTDGFCADSSTCGLCAHQCDLVGQVTCDQGRIHACTEDINGCRFWAEWEDCPDGFCADSSSCGLCDHGCDQVGGIECSAGKIRSCLADENACRAWSEWTDCDDAFCANEHSCGECLHECRQSGETDCSNGALRSCQQDENACRYWSEYVACADGFCADRYSCGNCDNTCLLAGEVECQDARWRRCEADANGCLAWTQFENCTEGFCADESSCGVCQHGCNEVGQQQCLAGELRTCQADEHDCRDWGDYAACADGFCLDDSNCGICAHECDLVDTETCVGGGLELCLPDDDGCRVLHRQACALGCGQEGCAHCDRPFSPVLGEVTALSGPADIFVLGQMALVADGNAGLKIFSVADPAHPYLLGSLSALGQLQAVVAQGQYAYLASRADGLQIIDIADPANPTKVGAIATHDARDLVLVGDHVFVADGESPEGGLKVIDVSDVTQPLLVGDRLSAGLASAIAYLDQRVYLACESGGLEILDVADPRQPAWLANRSGNFQDLAVVGERAYLLEQGTYSSGTDRLLILDIVNPAATTFLGSYPLDYNYARLALNGAQVTISADTALWQIDVSDPASPALVGDYRWPSPDQVASAIWSQANLSYAATSDGRLLVLDTAHFMRLATLPTEGGQEARDIAVQGPYLYLALESHLQVINIEDPMQPRAEGSLSLNSYGDLQALALAGSLALVVSDDGSIGGRLYVVDVRDPKNPALRARMNLAEGVGDVTVREQLVYLTTEDKGVVVFDISDPDQPVRLGDWADSSHYYRRYISFDQDHVYVSKDGNLLVIEVLFPAHPLLAGQTNLGVYIEGLAVREGRAYLHFDRKLKIVDVSDPLDMREIGVTDTLTHNHGGMALAGSLALVAESDGLRFIDISDPENPRPVGAVATYPLESRNVVVQGNVLFAATDQALFVHQICLP